MHGDLGRGFLDADLVTIIDPKLERWFARFGKGFRLDHSTDADVDLHKVIKGDLSHLPAPLIASWLHPRF